MGRLKFDFHTGDYRDDCENMLGRLLTHDDQKGDEELAGAFEATSGKWAETHATPYVWRANHRGHVDHRYYAFCGSCGSVWKSTSASGAPTILHQVISRR